MEYCEELSFGKIIGRELDHSSELNYVIFHNIFNSGKLFDPGKNIIGVSYDALVGYLQGASFGKLKKEFHLYNGISNATRNGFYPKLDFAGLDQNELEKLLEDSGLNKMFYIKDIRNI